MKKIGLLLIVAMTVAFASCKKDDVTSDYEKGHKEGLNALTYMSLIYNTETAKFSLPTTPTLETTVQILALSKSYSVYKENKNNEEWMAGFKVGVASGIGEGGTAELITFFDASETVSLISNLYALALLFK